MNNYKLNAHLIRKPDSTELKSEACEIVKWIPIPRSEFKTILDNPLRDNRAVTASRGLMYSDKDSAHCIMLLEEGGRDGILVESEGYDYARYACFVPNARALYEDHLMTEAEREIRKCIADAVEKAVEIAHMEDNSMIMNDSVDADEIIYLAKTAVILRLNQRNDVVSAEWLDMNIPFQPDVKLKVINTEETNIPISEVQNLDDGDISM